MRNLGEVLTSRKAGFGAILGFAAIGLPAAALSLFMLSQFDRPTNDELMGLGTFGVFGAIGCIGLFISVRLRFDICEDGIRARKLFSSFELPYSELAAVSVRRSTSGQSDLITGAQDLGYSVIVWNEAGQSAFFRSAGFGSDIPVEQAVRKMEGVIAQKMRARLSQGQAVEWMPGVSIVGGRVKGQVQRSVLATPILDFFAQPMDLALDDDSVEVTLDSGRVTISALNARVAFFDCDTKNYFPGVRVLREASQWQLDDEV